MPATARSFQPDTLDNRVVTVPDGAWIADHTALYINCFYQLAEQDLARVTDDIFHRTGFDVSVHTLSLEDLLGQRLHLSSKDRLHFMAGRPIWRLPAMFVLGGKGYKRASSVGQTLDEALAIHAVFGKRATEEMLKVDYDRSRQEWPRSQNNNKALQHAKELVEEALGVPLSVGKNGQPVGRPNNIAERDESGKLLSVIRARRSYKWKSALTIAREAVNRNVDRLPRARPVTDRLSLYNSNLNRATAEAAHFEELFGIESNGLAIGAWYRKVIRALRLGASLFAELDARRTGVAKRMLKANLEYQQLRHQPNRTRADRAKIRRRRASITRQAERFDASVGHALPRFDRAAGRIIADRDRFACISPLDAAIIAFFSGVNARDVIPGAFPNLPNSFAFLLEGLIWLGHFHRHRVRDLTFEPAYALQTALIASCSNDENAAIFTDALDMGTSFLNPGERGALFDAVTEVISSGEARTVRLRLIDVGERNLDIAVQALEAEDPIQPNGSSAPSSIEHLRRRRDPNEPERHFRFNPELDAHQSCFPELLLTGTFLTLPPAYERDWAGRWRIVRDQDDRFVDLIRAPSYRFERR